MPNTQELQMDVSMFLPRALLEEARKQANLLEIGLGKIFWIAWELGKDKLYGQALYADPSSPQPKGTIPPMQLPQGISLGNMIQPKALELASEKVSESIEIPKRVHKEIQELAKTLDRSPSWIFQHAYLEARPALLGIRA